MNLSTPLVSVCITAYNQEKYIAQAIESVLTQQTSFDVELVVGDDGSTDRTGEICRGYAVKYPDRVRLLASPVNLGMRANYKRIFEACRGRYIAICDGDDWWTDPQKLELQVELMESDPECGMCYARSYFWIEAEKRVASLFPAGKPHVTFDELILENTIPNPTALVRRELVESYYTEVRPLEKPWPLDDYSMWLWCAAHARIRFMDRVFMSYRVLSDSSCHFSDPRAKVRYEDQVADIRRWFDAAFGHRSHYRALEQQQILLGLELLKPLGFRASLGYWVRTVAAHPRLLLLGRGYHALSRAFRKSLKKTLKIDGRRK